MSNFDKHIKDKLSDAELPVAGGLWEAIESQIVIQKEPSKYWFLFLLAAFTLPILFLYEIGESNKKENQASVAVLTDSELDLDKTDIGLNSGISLDKLIIDTENPDDAIAASSELPLTAQLLKPNTPSLAKASNNTNISLINSDFSSPTLLNEEDNLDDLQSLDLITTEIESAEHAPALTGRSIDQILPLSHIIKPVREIEGRDLSFSRYYTARDCPSFAGFNPGMYFYGELDAGFSNHSLTAKQPDLDDYVAIRRATERGGLSLSGTIGLGYQFQNGMIAETGVSYDNVKLNFDPKGLQGIENTTVIVIKEIITGMDTTYSYDTLNHLDEVYADAGSNTFKQINIPFIIGQEFPLSSKLRLSLKGGIMINVVSMSKGQIVGNTQDHYPLYFGQGGEESNTELYKSNVGFGYTGGLNLEADLTDNITMYAGANIRYYPNTFSLASNNINQKFHRYGITTGLKYRL